MRPDATVGTDIDRHTSWRVGIQDVTGYGEKAFYDKGLKQLAVLKNGVFLIFTPPEESADPIADAKRIADVILPRI